MDPEIPINVVDLGLIYGVGISPENNNVDIKMTMTTRGCPLHDTLVSEDSDEQSDFTIVSNA